MSDPVSTARSARENLRQGLAALQAPGVPVGVTQAAEPVAQAMGALHQIEASGGAGLAQHAPVALEAVRRALGLLQAQPPAVPAVSQALEVVAGSLGLVHQLSQSVMASAATQMQAPPQMQAPSPVAQYQQPAPNYQPSQQPAPPAPQAYQQPAPAPAQAPAPVQAPAQWGGTHVMQPTGAQPGVPQPAPQYAQQPAQQYAPQPQQQYAPAYGQAPAGYPQQQPAPAPAQNPAYSAPAQQPAPAAPQQQWSAPAAARPQPAAGGATLMVEAELGAHSSTNFYKGLSGNDVIDSGGIFIATYQIPEIGQNLMIKVSLPGGYEFEAAGVVRWTREAPHSTRGVESPPGFGAQFTNISQEGRQLVYRYVRNREPLFHDDL